MKKRTIKFQFGCATIAGILLTLPSFAARSENSDNARFSPVPAYKPYPPQIFPTDLDSEIMRVQGETRVIEDEALGEWRQLPRPTTRGNPLTLQGTGYESVEVLGKLLNFDLNISPLRNESCSFCHMPYAGFSGPIPSVNLTMVAYPGTYHYRAAKRAAQRYTYSPDFPVLEYNSLQSAFFGGNFWDARATETDCKVQTQSKRNIRQSIPTKWAFPIRLASRTGYPKRCIGRYSRRYGGMRSTSNGRAKLKRSAIPRIVSAMGRPFTRQRHPYPVKPNRPRQGEQHL